MIPRAKLQPPLTALPAEDAPVRSGLALERAATHARMFLDTLAERPVGARASPEQLRGVFARPMPTHGLAPEAVIDELAAAADPGLVGSAGGRFFAWVIGGGLESAVAADWLTSVWDQNAALAHAGPAAVVVEETCGVWIKSLLRLPERASFALTTGCQMAHATCLAAARHALLARRGWDVEARGLFGAPPLSIVTSSERHSSVLRAARLLGMGADSIISLPPDRLGRLTPEALREALEALPCGRAVVLLQAGDLNIGGFDRFAELIPVAREHGAWVHVDGAFGLWAAASPAHRHLLDGVELADSWATDAHKWLNVPYDSGIAIVADRAAHRAAMTQQASYLSFDEAVREPMDWTPEFSRRARGFPIYAALRELGREGLADLIGRCCDHARALAEGIGALDGAEVLWRPQINQGLVRFPDPRPDATDAAHDARTDAVIAAVNGSGEAFFSGVTWRGRRAMRISVSNWRTTQADVARAVEAVRQALA